MEYLENLFHAIPSKKKNILELDPLTQPCGVAD